MNTNNNILLGDFFIIPNGSIALAKCWGKEQIIEGLKELFGEDYQPADDEPMVQVWYTDRDYEQNKANKQPTSENWACHGHPVLGIKPGEMVEVLPLSKIRELKEGDILNITYRGFKIELRAAQLPYRYRRFGDFQTVIAEYPR